MSTIQPFQALHYNESKIDLSKILCPPYDVIDQSLSEKLSKKNKYNSIYISYNLQHKEGKAKYSHVSKLIRKWKSGKILLKDSKPSFYFLQEEFHWKGKIKTRSGVFALIPVLHNKKIVPHEKVFQDAVADRLHLLQSTKTHVSPIYLIYEDKGKKFNRWLNKHGKNKALQKAHYDNDQIDYKFGTVSDEKSVEELQQILKDQFLLIADGHHRYETAKQFAKLRGKESYILAYIAPSSKDLVFSYHDVLSTVLGSKKVTTSQILKECKKGNLLPQKSTYFYPKVMTGFVFHEL